jgi:hypothetical protein
VSLPFDFKFVEVPANCRLLVFFVRLISPQKLPSGKKSLRANDCGNRVLAARQSETPIPCTFHPATVGHGIFEFKFVRLLYRTNGLRSARGGKADTPLPNFGFGANGAMTAVSSACPTQA